MKRNKFAYAFFLISFSCISVPLAQTDEQEPAEAFVTKVKGLGMVLTSIQTLDGYLSMSDQNQWNTVVLRKTSNSGRRILEKKISIVEPAMKYSKITGLAQTVDGYVFAGYQRVDGFYYYSGGNYGFLFKLDNNGQFQWGKTFNFSRPSFGQSATTTLFETVTSKPDGGLVVIGQQFQPTAILITSFASDGDILWNKSIKNFLAGTYTYYAQRVSDGIVLMSGTKILKVNDAGEIVWKKKLKIENFHISSLGFSQVDNGVVVAGNLGIPTQLMLVHLDVGGKVDWTQAYSFSAESNASTLLQTSDGGYLIGGWIFKGGIDGTDGMFFKINSKRNVVFQSSFGGPRNQDLQSVFTRNKGYFLIGSSSPTDMLIVGSNSNAVVPGCNLINKFTIIKVASATVATEDFKVVSEDHLLPRLETTRINILDTQNPIVKQCQ